MLNAHWFHTLAEAQGTGFASIDDYNTTHAYRALHYRTPEEFLAI